MLEEKQCLMTGLCAGQHFLLKVGPLATLQKSMNSWLENIQMIRQSSFHIFKYLQLPRKASY